MKYSITLSHPLRNGDEWIEAGTTLRGVSQSLIDGLKRNPKRHDIVVPDDGKPDNVKPTVAISDAHSTSAAEHTNKPTQSTGPRESVVPETKS